MANKKILGLDIGTTSIAYSIIEASDAKSNNIYSETLAFSDINNDRIGLHKNAEGNPILGVRIISQDTDKFDKGEKLNQGSTLTPTANRRKFRGMRRMRNRYKLRRNKLHRVFYLLGIKPDETYFTNAKGKRGKGNDIGKALYKLRDKASKESVSLGKLCRVVLHLNQLRGYSSDRFAKDEETKFDYHLVEVIESDWEGKISITEKNNTNEIKYYQIKTKLRFIEPYVQNGNDEKKVFESIEGYIFKKEINFKKGDFITIKTPELKQNKKGKVVVEEYYKITPTNPDPADWKYKYQTLHKNLADWCKTGSTVGSYFYNNFYEVQNLCRIRNNVVNRDWYEKEFDTIWNLQYEAHKNFFESINVEELTKEVFKDYSQVLNDITNKGNNREKLRTLIKDKIIFYQRPWQQAKSKGRCEFEKIKVKRSYAVKGTGAKEIKEEHVGRPVVPRSHPLFQEFKIWQQINNLRLFYNTPDEKVNLFDDEELFKQHTRKTIDQIKLHLFNKLQGSKTLSWRTYVKEELEIETFDEIEEKRTSKSSKKLAVNTDSGEIAKTFYSVNFRKRKKDGAYDDIKLKGNTTRVEIKNILSSKAENWLDSMHETNNSVTHLQLLWEIIYDITITDVNKVATILKKHFDIPDEIAISLAKIKFDDSGMANLSAKAIRNLLPLMITGENLTDKAEQQLSKLIQLNKIESEKDDKLESLKNFITDRKARIRLSNFSKKNDFKFLNYWEAAAIVYGSHSSKKTAGNGVVEKVRAHSMNNPVVEKIVNETISIVNELYHRYKFDEVRIELSRELRASADERQQMWENMTNNATKNEWAKRMLRELKQALIDDDRDISRIDTEVSGSNLDKIKIIEDVVKYQNEIDYKSKVKEYKLTEPSNAEVTKYLLWLEQNFRCPYTNQPIPLTDIFARGNVVEIEHIIPRERYYSNAYSNKVITWREVNQLKENNGNRTAYEFIVSKRLNNTVKVGKSEFELVPAIQWEEHIKSMFPKGGKRNNLLRKEIPEDPIERTLKETQYINKKLKEKLGELVGSDKVWVTSGAVTDILREKWKLNDIWKDLVEERFTKFNAGEAKERLNLKYTTKHYNQKTGQYEDVERYAGMSKRIDHRHHAMDAIIIACTKQNHIQYISNLNAINSLDLNDEESKKKKYSSLKKDVCQSNGSSRFKFPWDENAFIPEVRNALQSILISHKNVNILISPSKHRIKKEIKSGKVASVRGELHLQTNYTKRKYFEGEKIKIDKLIPLLFKKKIDNLNQTLVRFKSFEEIIKETVVKEKYQVLLLPLFAEYDTQPLTPKTSKDFTKVLLEKIKNDSLFKSVKTGGQISWLSVYTDKNAAVRPMGLSMDLNNEKEVKDIANPRLRRIAFYRLKYVNEQIDAIRRQKLFKDEENTLVREIKDTPLFSNAIYEIRVKIKEDEYRWIELKNIQSADIDKIEYANSETTLSIKSKLQKFSVEELKERYIRNPIFLSKNPILVKKARQKSFFQDLYQLNDGRYVYSRDVFMTYVFVPNNSNRKDGKRELEFLKFFDAVKIITAEKPDKIDYSKLITKPEYDLLFTLSKNDIVYLPDEELKDEQINEINWNNRSEIIPKLYVVKDMNPSRNEIIFQHIYKSDSISVTEDEARALFSNPILKKIEEEIKYGDTNMWKRCIKVFIEKIGNKVLPFWLSRKSAEMT